MWPGLHPHVAVGSRVGPAGTQRFERIDDERKRLKINANFFDRFRGGKLVDRGHGENRFALVERLHSEPPFAPLGGLNHCAIVGKAIGRSGKLLRSQNRSDARHGERLAGIDPRDAPVRQRTQQQFAEEHPFGAKVFGVLRLASDLCMQIRGYVVLADQLVLSAVSTLGSVFIFARHCSPSA